MSSRPKILHIISSWENGAGNELAEFAVRLSTEFESQICVLTYTHKRNVPDVPITTLGQRWTYDVSTHFGVGRLLRQFRPDVVHAWDAVAHSYAALHHGRQRVLVEKRETDSPKSLFRHYINKKTHRFIVPRPDDTLPAAQTIVIPPAAVSVPYSDPLSTEEFLEKLDFPLVEPVGNYYSVFQPQYEPERQNYKATPQSQTPFLIGIVLPLCLEHRILDALWAFETLNHVHLNFHAFIIGSGRDQDIFLRHRDRWKLFSRVYFLGSRHDTFRLLPHFDALLHLSSSAEYSGTILSAMSCGVPVVALETPESREYILDGKTGLLIPTDGDFRFYRRTAVKRLLYLLENEELRRSMQTAAIERIDKEYNFDRAVQQRIALYRELTGSRH